MSRTATFLWAARLLHYPGEELAELGRGACGANGAREAGTPDGIQDAGGPPPWAAVFLEHVARTPLLELQGDFVRTFDHNAAACLYLTTHVYGDSPLQGRALAALLELYRDGGCEPVPGELPDYLPMMLEFLAVAPPWAAECLCGKFAPVAARIAAHLHAAASPWADMLQAVAEAMRECAPGAPDVPDVEEGRHALSADPGSPYAAPCGGCRSTAPVADGPHGTAGAPAREVFV